MISKDLLRQVIYEQREVNEGLGVSRQIDSLQIESPEVLVISGVRRCGKSVLLQQIRSKQQEQDYFLNFDDDRLLHFTVDDFQTLCDILAEDFGMQHTFFLDEIQLIPGWEHFVNRLYRQKNKVFITGSNAKLLSRELGTLLTGRHLQQTLYPLSLKEFAEIKGYTWQKKDFHTTEGRAGLLNLQKKYLDEGGFPQYVSLGNPRFLKELYSDIIYRDIVVRHNLPADKPLREVGYYLASNNTHRYTNSSIAKAAGIKSIETVSDYISYLEETYLIGILTKYDHKVGEQIKSPRKIYFIDNGLVSQIGFSFSKNTGAKLENAVYIELKRREKDIFYFSDGGECDFIVRNGSKIETAYQVTMSLSEPSVEHREISGLKSAMDAFHLEEGYIITYDESGERKLPDGREIHVIPFYKWVLQPS